MRIATMSGRPAGITADASPAWRPAPDRTLLVFGAGLALLAAGAVAARSPASVVDPDLMRVLRCMALIKGGFAALALAACLWRLGRPAAGWRRLAYVAGPPLMAGSAVALWSLQALGLAALGLHAGLFGVLAAGLTDASFLDGLRRRA